MIDEVLATAPLRLKDHVSLMRSIVIALENVIGTGIGTETGTGRKIVTVIESLTSGETNIPSENGTEGIVIVIERSDATENRIETGIEIVTAAVSDGEVEAEVVVDAGTETEVVTGIETVTELVPVPEIDIATGIGTGTGTGTETGLRRGSEIKTMIGISAADAKEAHLVGISADVVGVPRRIGNIGPLNSSADTWKDMIIVKLYKRGSHSAVRN